MKKILNIISSPRGAQSSSIRLSNSIIEKLAAEHPGSEIVERNLSVNPLPHLEESLLTSFFTPAETHSEAHQKAIANSDAAIAEVKAADIIVIGLPMYNFGIPSTLKAWLDHILRAGVTFKYGPNGPEGLLNNKKIYLSIASGGIYSEGAMASYDFTEPYLRKVLGFIGLTDVTAYRAEGLAMAGGDTILDKVIDSLVL